MNYITGQVPRAPAELGRFLGFATADTMAAERAGSTWEAEAAARPISELHVTTMRVF